MRYRDAFITPSRNSHLEKPMKHFAVLGAFAFFACGPVTAADGLLGPIKAIGAENE